MRARGPLAQVWSDLADLFSHEDRRFWFLFVAAILLQAGFWYLATPGPRLLALEVRLPENAVRGVLWTATLLLVIPFLLGTLLRFQPAETRPQCRQSKGSASWLCWRSGLSRCRSCSFLLTTEQSSSRTHGQDPGQDQQSPRSHSGRGSICFTMSLSNTFSEAFCCSWSPGNGVRPAGIWFQATAATLITLGRPLTEVLVALPLSILLGVLVVRSRSLLYPVVLHWLLGVSTDVFSLYHQKLFFP